MSQPIRVLELRSVRGTGGGPEKTILLGTARTDRSRFAITVCYIRDKRDTVFGIDQRAAHLDIDYHELLEAHSFDLAIWKELRRLIREKQIDIVHAHEYKTDVLAWLLAKFEKVVPLATAHGWTGHSRRERRFYYPLDKRVLARYPQVIAVSSEIRNELIRHGASPDRVVTVLNGIDHERFHRDPSKERWVRAQHGITDADFVIGSVGRLEPQKRFDLLIDAVAELRSAHPQILLLIAGDGSLRQALGEQLRARGLGARCRLLGHCDDVPELHHAFDLYVQSSNYEGTPNSVLEAMAMSTPVVATDVGGTAELIRDGVDGLIVPPGQTPALVSAINAALADPLARPRWVASARARVETTLSFATRMNTVETIYTDLLRRAGSPRAATAATARL